MVPAVPAFWTRLWASFEDSYEPEMNTAVSSPVGVVATSGVIAIALAVIGYLPPVAARAGIAAPYLGVGLALLGGALSYVAWVRRCRGKLGVLATLLDTPFYSGAFVATAASAHQGVGLALAALHGLMLIGAQAQHYALTPLFAVVVALPTALVMVVHPPPLATSVALLSTIPVVWVVSYQTGQRRGLLRAKRQAEEALAVAGRLADDSMHAVLGTTLLTLSDFLHELRNAQTVVRTNLNFLLHHPMPDEVSRAALDDALEGHLVESELVAATLRRLREQAGPASEPFSIGAALQAAVTRVPSRIEISVTDEAGGFEVRGTPEYLVSVLKNLIRNAEQAGAHHVWVTASVERDGTTVLLRIYDDGPGIPPPARERAFATFTPSSRADGTGLGLYLVRRYVELLGGTVALLDGPQGGAEIRIRLPSADVLHSTAPQPTVVH